MLPVCWAEPRGNAISGRKFAPRRLLPNRVWPRRRRAFSSRRRIFSCSGGSNGRDSEPFSVIPRSPLRATCQHFLEILLYARKHRGDISWEPAFFRQGLKRDLPIRCRPNQTPRQIVCSSSLKRQTQGVQDLLCLSRPPDLIRRARSTKSFTLAVRSVPRERVSMNLFSELLLASDHPDARRFDASESQPVPADDCFQRLHNHVTNAGIQVESGKDPFVHSSFDRIASPAIRRGGQIDDRRSDRVLEPVTKRDVSHALQHPAYNLVRVTTRRCCCPHSLQCQVDVHR